jgi:hypothetical protein
MAISNPSLLRNTIALSSTLLLILSIVTIYKTASAAILLRKSLQGGQYVWFHILGLAGQERRDAHNVNLTFDWASENFVWTTASISTITGLLSLVKLGVQERERRRIIDGIVSLILPNGRKVL